MEEPIELQEPELVAMGPEERREAVRLLAALIRAARPSLPAGGRPSRKGDVGALAGALPLGPGDIGNPAPGKIAGRGG